MVETGQNDVEVEVTKIAVLDPDLMSPLVANPEYPRNAEHISMRQIDRMCQGDHPFFFLCPPPCPAPPQFGPRAASLLM